MCMKKNKYLSIFKEGVLTNNPTFVQLLGMCPTLAVTTSVTNAIGMGAAVIVVLMCSNLFISLVRKLIPPEVYNRKVPDAVCKVDVSPDKATHLRQREA